MESASTTMDELLQTQTDLIQTYAKYRKEAVDNGAPAVLLEYFEGEYEMLMEKINRAIEKQRLLDRMM